MKRCKGNRTVLVAVAGSVVLALSGWAGADELDYRVEVEVAHKELSDKLFWFHPYLAAVPGAGQDGHPAVLLVTQKHLVADDHYSNTFVMRTNDLGKTWSGPTPVEQLKWLSEGGYDLAISAIVPNWHAETGKLIAVGSSNLHNRPSGFIDRAGASWVFYTVYDPKTDAWSDWQPLGERAKDCYGTASGCSQWLIEPDGSILLPLYAVDQAGEPWHVEVWKCAFDGQTLRRVATGNKLVRNLTRGLHEPSITRFQGRYLLTIRSDDGAFVSASDDGLHFEPIKPWTYDDSAVLGSYNTQQHWVTHSDGLFLTYTRRGANNDHVFRHRAPIFIARVDPEKLVVLRATERVLLPDRGVPMGNFGAADVTESETWVTVGENMWRDGGRDPTYRGAEGAVLVARIIWSKPNRVIRPGR